MDILVRIGVLVVVTVMGGPPERPLLPTGGAPEAHNELEEPAGLIGAVGEVTVVDTRDGEHAEVVHEDAHGDGRPADAGQESEDTDDVHTEKGDAAAPIDLLFFGELAAELLGEGLVLGVNGLIVGVLRLRTHVIDWLNHFEHLMLLDFR